MVIGGQTLRPFESLELLYLQILSNTHLAGSRAQTISLFKINLVTTELYTMFPPLLNPTPPQFLAL